MDRKLARAVLAVVMAFAIVFPPVSDTIVRALGGEAHHAHFDHVWHQAGVADLDHDDEIDGHHAGDAQSHSFLDHIHLAVMALPAEPVFDLATPERVYDPVTPPQLTGRALAPPGHPPQLNT